MNHLNKVDSTPSHKVSFSPKPDSSPSSYSNLGFSQIIQKPSLINSAINMLETRKKPPTHGIKFEMDLMEEKHREIIDTFDKIREIRAKK